MIRRLLIAAAVCLVLLIVTIALIVVSVQRSGAKALEAAKQQWEPLGGVPDLAAMRPSPISDERNAAVVYMHAYDVMQPIADAHRMEEGERPFSPAICDEPALKQLIEMAAAAAAKPACVWESPWFDEGFEALLPHLGSARTLALLLAAAAECRLDRGDPEGAARSIAAGLVLGSNVTATEPSILSALVAASIHGAMLHALEETFREQELPRDQGIGRVLDAISYRDMLHRCLIGEAAVGFDAFTQFGGTVPSITILVGWSIERDMAQYLDLMRHGVEQLDAPPAERDWSAFEKERSMKAMLTNMIAPAIHRGVNNALAVEARLILAREAIKLREHRAAHGEYPDSWPMPSDPQTGSPLRYERDDDGFVLWSDAEVREGRERIEWRWQ